MKLTQKQLRRIVESNYPYDDCADLISNYIQELRERWIEMKDGAVGEDVESDEWVKQVDKAIFDLETEFNNSFDSIEGRLIDGGYHVVSNKPIIGLYKPTPKRKF